jgi:hypothetical protein
MRRPARLLVATTLAAASVVGFSTPSSAATNGPCDLPDIVSTSPVISSSGQQVAVAQLRRQTVHHFLSSYYRYCARLTLTKAPPQATIGTVTLKHTLRTGAQPVLYTTTGPITYPSFGLSSPIVDVHRGTVGYAVSLRPASG